MRIGKNQHLYLTLTIEKLERVMWRLRKIDNHTYAIMSNKQLETSIMKEIGTDQRTYNNTRRALKKLGWIQPVGSKRFMITNRDLND